MQNDRITDFTQGSIPRHLVAFALPMFLGNLLQALYNTVDSIWVGRFLGANALAAVSVSFPVIFALVAMVNGITMATTILVSQYFGAQQHRELVRAITNSIVLLTIMGVVLSAIGVGFRGPMLQLINTPDEILEMAMTYLGIFMAGLVGMFLYNAAGAILRGLGDSRTPLRFLVYATVLNIILDPIFIFGLGPVPAMGVGGAALATIIAQGISAVLSLRYLYVHSGLLHYQPGMLRLDWQLTRLTFKIGLPAGIQQMLVSLSAVVVNSIVNSFGATVIAGFGAGSRLDQFAFMPSMSMGMAVSALVGQNLGAGKTERVSETVKWGAILASGITLVVSAVAVLRPRILMVLFTQDEAVLAEGSRYLRYMAFSYIPMALMFTIGGVIRGAGDTVATMYLTLGSLWIVRVPLARYLSSIPELGVDGVWLALLTGTCMGLVFHLLYYRTGRWKRKVIVQRPPETS
ncbi:MAG TPA: MATE family efflux transporter [Firmicutes bacterium]|nr:MATE family efflux transporter [Bacillota bacterium]